MENRPQPLDYAKPPPRRNVIRPAIVWTAIGAVSFCIISYLATVNHQYPREQSNRVKCASNMRQIGQALQMWANDHGGNFPNQLSDVLDEDLTASVFNCPDTDDTPATGATTRAIAADVTAGGHLSYIYLGKGLTTQAASDVVLLYEPLANHQNQGMNVLFADGHVDFLQAKDVQPLLRQVANHVTPVRLP